MKKDVFCSVFLLGLVMITQGCSNAGASDASEIIVEEKKQISQKEFNPSSSTVAVIDYFKSNSPITFSYYEKDNNKFSEVVESTISDYKQSDDGRFIVSMFYSGLKFEELVTYPTIRDEGGSHLVIITSGEDSKVVEEFYGRGEPYNISYEADHLKYFLEGNARCIRYSDFSTLNKDSNKSCDLTDNEAQKLSLNDGVYRVFSMYSSKGGMAANQNTYKEVEFRYTIDADKTFTCILPSSKKLYDTNAYEKQSLTGVHSTKHCVGSVGVLLGPFDSKESMIQAFEDGEKYDYSLGPWYREEVYTCTANTCI